MAALPRLYHLDALRAFCMLYGLLVHGATLGSNLLFTAIQVSSDHFRMAAFFLVSGFFTALMHERVSMNWALNRARVVLLPLVSALLLLNPLTWYLVRLWREGGLGLPAWLALIQRDGVPLDWLLHLWFLLALFLYAMLTPALVAMWRWRPVALVVQRAAAWRASPALVALGAGLAVTGLHSVHDLLIAPHVPARLGFPVMATFNYLPFFALGVGAWAHRALYERLHTLAWATLAVAGAAYLGAALLADDLPRAVQRVLFWTARGATILTIVMALLWAARRLVRRASPLLATLTSSVYTFYIFHYAFIYLIAWLLLPLGAGPLTVFAVVLAVGFPLLIRLHTRVVARSPLLLLLLNGRAPAPATRAA